NFYWDFGPQTPHGPGQRAAIFSNCERLELFVDGKQHSILHADREALADLKYPPFFIDLQFDGVAPPELLRIDGYIAGRLALSRSFSSNHKQDRFSLKVDDVELVADGSDATRVTFGVVDEYGAERAFASGTVTFELTGPGIIVGDNPFSLEEAGGVGAIWIRTLPDTTGRVRVRATHSSLGMAVIDIRVEAADPA